MASIYEPLDEDRLEIRMLTILPALPGSIMRCKLKKSSLLNHDARYSALSYRWGDPDITTNIIVNDTETPVTVNLADALQQLRQWGVRKIWVDAICINQNDKREKSHQIRNLKHVYSRAKVTYAWLGNQPLECIFSPIQFLEAISLNEVNFRVQHSHPMPQSDDTGAAVQFLAQHSGVSVHQHMDRAALQTTSCQCCILKYRFHELIKFLNSDYWKRRWIIQEVVVSTNVQVIYGQGIMPLQKMTRALDECRRRFKHYWLRFEEACSYITVIVDLRNRYHAKNNFPLCEAITITRRSQSSEPRDRVFALLGICSDGADLVPTPSYYQAPHLISRGITEALIRKTRRLDVILAGNFKQTSVGLPTWSPDWLSPDLPESANYSARTFCLPLAMETLFHGNILKVEGMMLGSISSITTALRPTIVSLNVYLATQPKSTSTQVSRYYKDKHCIARALYSCLSNLPLQSSEKSQGFQEKIRAMQSTIFPSSWFYRKVGVLAYRSLACSLIVQKLFHHLSFKSKTIDLESRNAVKGLSWGIFDHWLTTNTSFSVNGTTLKELLGGHLAKSLVEIELTRTTMMLNFLISIFALCVLLYGPPAALLFFLYTHYSRYNLLVPIIMLATISIMSSSLPLSIYWHCWKSWIKAFKDMQTFLTNLDSTSPLAKKLFFSDKGFIGMTSSEGKVGDKICFLVGCRNGVLLREIIIGDQLQYRVVGEVMVVLLDRDHDLYEGFVKSTDEKIPRDSRVVRRYREKGLMQKFELI